MCVHVIVHWVQLPVGVYLRNDSGKLFPLITNTQQTWRQEFLGCWSLTVERPSTRASAAGTLLRFFQTISENTSFWQLKRLVTFDL